MLTELSRTDQITPVLQERNLLAVPLCAHVKVLVRAHKALQTGTGIPV